MVAGAAPGLQIRVSGRKTFRGVFDSHASPPIVAVYGSNKRQYALSRVQFIEIEYKTPIRIKFLLSVLCRGSEKLSFYFPSWWFYFAYQVYNKGGPHESY